VSSYRLPSTELPVGFLKEKSPYRPTRLETVVAWVVTAAAGLVVALFLARSWFGRA
jgi:hypothetical protein